MTGAGGERELFKETKCVLFARYERNQERTVPVRARSERRFRRMAWEMVSKAAERSRRMSRLMWPESAAIRRSFVILMRAVSVLWCFLYADCRISNSRFFDMC